jgi:carboxymethylenebutenolidase
MQNQDRASNEEANDLSRRDVVKLAVGAALTTSVTAAAGEARPVEEKDVEIKTPDGVCDAAFIYPTRGAHPGVLIWTDAFGLRPAMRDIGKRIAAEGYAVLVPNPYYRAGAANTLDLNAKTFSFQNQDDMARLRKLMSGMQTPGGAEQDAAAYVAFLDAQKQVDKHRKIGTQGYCMGGAARIPNRCVPAGSDRRRSLFPWRRPCYRPAEQSAPACAEDQGKNVRRYRRER